ncbi:hypothetical protein C2G38_2187299 [Gigaspora rosea]|uniref:Uncharacterized protein n=1 Tax=Gigaspora rosea TaxID=44941 RepID=A0A397V5X9_9GLOM|nr:hypothetical protein C2G38_2187299 [Gigaspora rosea]
MLLKIWSTSARANEVTDLIILHEHSDEPELLYVIFPYGLTAYFSLHNFILHYDIQNKGAVSQAPCVCENNNKEVQLAEVGSRMLNGSYARIIEQRKSEITYRYIVYLLIVNESFLRNSMKLYEPLDLPLVLALLVVKPSSGRPI